MMCPRRAAKVGGAAGILRKVAHLTGRLQQTVRTACAPSAACWNPFLPAPRHALLPVVSPGQPLGSHRLDRRMRCGHHCVCSAPGQGWRWQQTKCQMATQGPAPRLPRPHWQSICSRRRCLLLGAAHHPARAHCQRRSRQCRRQGTPRRSNWIDARSLGRSWGARCGMRMRVHGSCVRVCDMSGEPCAAGPSLKCKALSQAGRHNIDRQPAAISLW